MLKFFHVGDSKISNLFKGNLRGPEYPNNPWSLVVSHFSSNPDVKTLVVSGGRVPKLSFEIQDKLYYLSIDNNTRSKNVINWVEKLLHVNSPKVEVKEEIIEEIMEEEPKEKRQSTDRKTVNGLAGGSMAIALCALIGAAVGSVIAAQEEDSQQVTDDFLLLDENGKPFDFQARDRIEREKNKK